MLNYKKSVRQLNEYLRNSFKLRTLTNLTWAILRLILIVGLGYLIIRPLLVTLISSFLSPSDIYNPLIDMIPSSFNLDNLRTAWIVLDFPIAITNSIILSSMVSVLNLISCTLVGYGLARFEFKGRNIIFYCVILMLVIPPQSVMVPLFLNFRFFSFFGLLSGENTINLIGSYWPFIITSITATGFRNGLYVYIMRQFFLGMPKGLEESAYVDGAGAIKTFYKVMLPGAFPAILIVFLFSFVWQWNDIFYVGLFLRGTDHFLQLRLVQSATRYFNLFSEWYGEGLQPTLQETSLVVNAASILFFMPIILFFGALQRYFVESIERTGIVG